jgi:conjugative relaxase-like TrwC/TraI family protein
MWKILPGKNANAVIKYHDEGLARDDYYREKGVESNWLGKGAERLGLEGEVKRNDFVAIVKNRDPNRGNRLTLRDKSNRRPVYEATVTAWKSASVMSEVYGCRDIRDAFERTGDETMVQCAEPEMRTRVRKDGADYDRITANAIIAGFPHENSRPEDGWSDAHLHKHYLIANATWDGVENRWKAAQLGDLKAKAPQFELEHDYRFARELMNLGYVPTMGKHGLQLKGVPQSVIDKNSRSSFRNEKEAEALGVTDAKEKRKLFDRLRKSKKGDLSPEALKEKRLSELTEFEKAALEKVKRKEIKPGPQITPRQATEFAIEHLFQRKDGITENKLRKTIVHYAVGHVSPKQADVEIASAIKDGLIIPLDNKKGRWFVKASTLQMQQKILDRARDGIGQYEPPTFRYEDDPALSAEQNAMARFFAESRDKYLGGRGPAGTGKSYTLRGVKKVIDERKGKGEEYFSRALAIAPSSGASRGNLAKEGFPDAVPVAAFLENEKLQKEMQNQFLIVDEAAMASTADDARLTAVAEKYNMRVLRIGDWHQHESVDAGGMFRLLKTEGVLKYPELTENRRQYDPKDREAVNAMSTDTPEGILKGFDRFDELGAVTVEKDREKLRQKLTKAFLKAKDEGDTALITTPTHKEADYLTDHLREALRECGQIKGEEQEVPTRRSTHWTTAQKRDVRNYEPGMVVEFHKDIGGERKSVNGTRQTTGGFKRGEKGVVIEYESVVPKLGRKSGLMLLREDGSRASLPFEHADRFEVYSSGTKSFAVGDQIRITKNGRVKVAGQGVGTRVNNGDVYPIEGFTKEGNFRLQNGKLLPRNYGHVDYGYTSTSQHSQGNTVDWNFVDWNSETLRAVDRPAAYVPSSRFRKGITYFVDNKKAVRAAIQRRDENKTAYELVKEYLGEERVKVQPRKFTLGDHLARNRIARYLSQGVSALRQMGRNVVQSWRDKGGIQYA